MSTHKNSKGAVRLPLYVAITLCIGVFIGANMAGSSTTTASDFMKSLTKFRQVLTHIENDYVDEVNSEDLVESAITNMLEDLDPHTSYIPAKDLELIQSRLEGNYEGVGIEFNIFKDTIHVVSPLSGGPSEKLGIRAGDKIIKVDGERVAGIGINNQRVVELLRGPGGSKVTVSIKRDGEDDLIDYTIERDVIPQFSVDVSYMVDDEIGYIKVARFANSTYLEFKEALLKLKDQGMKKLVIDLTGNPGGYLNRAVQIADELLADRQMIVYTDGKEKRYAEQHYSGEPGDFEEGSLVIMVDEGSASASEIVAGAMQDHDRGLIVGRRSFGKGLVQLPIDLNDGSELRLTISRYYTPSGRSIQKTYSNGKLDEYYMEAYERYENGEVYSSDSIKNIDTLAFKTDKGRIVYGGGGITPDVFVPLDTAYNTRYLNRLFSTNSIQEYTVMYAQENREELERMGYEKFKNEFEISEQMLADLVSVSEGNGLSFNELEYKRSRKLLKQLMRAYIARGIWDNEGFYPIFNQQDEIFQKAIQLMDEADKIAQR
ncbi:carboxyl-terminal processing protease [Ekhidna lutea]|uniref:Carboxyl-terminal processing protease n=1 Tax=Ekhidna lutea TaxID=447679 RepID=A0A239FPA4_EKHLU|nr:S41 family peptidase [Ekhidna lutea]SNS58438.1 carboxyl-terminal processing protease [Ekhidna lutea]